MYWDVDLSTGQQYVYRSIPSFSGNVRLTAVGQVDSVQPNCYGVVGIGDGVDGQTAIGLRFGYRGGCNPGYRINAIGVDLGDSCVNSVLVEAGTQYAATLTIRDSVTLNVEGQGSATGTPVYTGSYNTLWVGSPWPGSSDPGQCTGSIERVIIEPLDGAPPLANIDIKPGSSPNSINCNNEKGIIAVAILTTEDFDATTVDHTTVTFEGASETHVDKTGEPRRHEEDVDGDGDIDLVFHFRLGDTDLTCDSTVGTLTGENFDGQLIVGTDTLRMVDKGGGKS